MHRFILTWIAAIAATSFAGCANVPTPHARLNAPQLIAHLEPGQDIDQIMAKAGFVQVAGANGTAKLWRTRPIAKAIQAIDLQVDTNFMNNCRINPPGTLLIGAGRIIDYNTTGGGGIDDNRVDGFGPQIITTATRNGAHLVITPFWISRNCLLAHPIGPSLSIDLEVGHDLCITDLFPADGLNHQILFLHLEPVTPTAPPVASPGSGRPSPRGENLRRGGPGGSTMPRPEFACPVGGGWVLLRDANPMRDVWLHSVFWVAA